MARWLPSAAARGIASGAARWGCERELVEERGLERGAGAFDVEQTHFGVEAAGCGEAAGLAARGQDTVTGYDDGKRIGAQGLANGAGGARGVELGGNFAVGQRLARRDGTGGGVDFALKVGNAGEVEFGGRQIALLAVQQGLDIADGLLDVR